MTKQERIKIMRKAIRETKNTSKQKWTVDERNAFLKWEYLTSEFFYITVYKDEELGDIVMMKYKSPIIGEEKFASVFVGNEFYHDCKTLEDAIYMVTQRTILKANNTF